MAAQHIQIRSAGEAALQWCIEDLPAEPVAVGKGSAIVFSGWCFHRESAIAQLSLHSTRGSAKAAAHSLPRPDVFDVLRSEGNPDPHAYSSGFYVILPLFGLEDAEIVDLFMQVQLADGRELTEGVARIPMLPGARAHFHPDLAGSPVVICMATYDPDYELFSRQVETIVSQSEGGWRCLINDDHSAPDHFDRMRDSLAGDDRFVIERNEIRQGTYRNFEQALARVPPDTAYVALADQDDRWYPDKLATLIDAVEPGGLLAYSDSRVCRPDGTVTSETFFPRRENNWRDLRRLVLANTVTGAASLIRRELLDDALPFPPEVELSFHDHWLALVALGLGELRYVDRPLYDYVQHGENLLGHTRGQRLDAVQTRFPWMVRNRIVYQHDILRIGMLANALEQRLADRIPADKRQELARLRKLERSAVTTARLLLQATRAQRISSATLGLERDLLAGLSWRQIMSRAGRTKKHLYDNRYSSEFQRSPGRRVQPGEFADAQRLDLAGTPLRLSVDPRIPVRTNLLLPRLSSQPPSAAHLIELQLALTLARAERAVRIVVCEPQLDSARGWADWLGALPGTADTPIEVVDVGDRRQPLSVSPADSFLATDWSTALVARAAEQQLGSPRFVYLIQEYGPAVGSSASVASAAEHSYRLPHRAVFSSEFLREHFRARGLGVFAPSAAEREPPAINFSVPVSTDVFPVADGPRARGPLRLLLDAHPEDSASMFEMALTALGRFARRGVLDRWECNGLGGAGGAQEIELAPGVVLVMLGAPAGERYPELLRSHDVGLSLLAGARASATVMDMACAGLVTVTNACPVEHNQPGDGLGNLIPVAGTVEAIEAGLVEAAERAPDLTARREAALVRWPRDWDEAFDQEAFELLTEWLESRHPAGDQRDFG